MAELIVILELHRQGMTVSAIARRTGLHRSTVASENHEEFTCV